MTGEDAVLTLTASLSTIPHISLLFVREVGSCIAKKYEPDVHRVAGSIIKSKGCTAERAMEFAMNPHYRRHIRTFTPHDCAERLWAVYNKYLALSNLSVEKGERPLYQ